MKVLAFSLVAFTLVHGGYTQHLRGAGNEERHLDGEVYFQTSDPALLGAPNEMAAIGNPLKGLAGGSRYAPPPLPESVPLAIEFFNIGLDEMMTGPNEFDWTELEKQLSGSASRNMHAVFSPFIHWPGRPLRLPSFLKDIEMIETNSGLTPYYGDPKLLEALEQFITALGAKFDGDKRIMALHTGLLGFWGEFHCYPVDCVPEDAKESVVQWYRSAFQKTQIQLRYPRNDGRGLGLYDGSFGHNTLDGEPNGGVQMGWYFWPKVQRTGQTDFWKTAVMGGETRPELQKTIFTNSYPSRTYEHQDFIECVDQTHATYVLHHDAFQNGGYSSEELLDKALKAHAHLGYNFYVSSVAVSKSVAPNQVDIAVVVNQLGVAPFYYDLALGLECDGLPIPMKLAGVDDLVDQNDFKTFEFTGVPATEQCLSSVSLSLESSYAYASRPIKFAQGTHGTITLNLPLPAEESIEETFDEPEPLATDSPTNTPTDWPTKTPTGSPTGSPTDSPISSPTGSPAEDSLTDSPTAAPYPSSTWLWVKPEWLAAFLSWLTGK